MQGDFSVLNFDPHEHERGVEPASNGVLRNVHGVLHQQGRVTTDADQTEGELLDTAWSGQAGRDIIGAGVCAVPADRPDGFRIDSAFVSAASGAPAVHVTVRPGRAWVDGILTRLAGGVADPAAAVERVASYLGPPLAIPLPTPDSLGDTVRDAVILEVSEEALHGLQYPLRLIEPALGGPDTSERAFVNFRLRLLRLAAGEDCATIGPKLRDDLGAKGKLTASLAPSVAIGGDCPVVGGGGYSGFEHHLWRIEIAETGNSGPARFKWSQFNGGLVGRGRFDATVTPPRVTIDAGRAPIVHANLVEFYLEALQYDELSGAWEVVYGGAATLNADNDLDLGAPPLFGMLPATTDPVVFRLWNGIEDIASFTDATAPVELRDGIRLVFDVPAAGNYRPSDYWTFALRAGEIGNPEVLIDAAPPVGIVYHRVPLAEIAWTGRLNTTISGSIEDCRKRFRPLTNQKLCCTFLIGDGLTSFGDFNSLEQAAAHLPLAGGELCLLPGLHRANLKLEARRNITLHGCGRRSLLLPRTESRAEPIVHVLDCIGIRLHDLDLITFDAVAVLVQGRRDGLCRDIRIHDNRMIARRHCIRADEAAELDIHHNRLHLLDTAAGLATVSLAADDSHVERNTLVLLPFVDTTPTEPDTPDDDPTRDPADPCARPEILYANPSYVLAYAVEAWSFTLAFVVPQQPYRAVGGIHLRAGCERVELQGNRIVGGAGNGITLGGDIELPAPPPEPVPVNAADAAAAAVTVDATGRFLALVQDEAGVPQPNVDVYLAAPNPDAATATAIATDRSDADGLASIKAAPARYELDVSAGYRIVRVAETRDNGVLVNAITVAPRAAASVYNKREAFLHEITIDSNDVSMMGLSGIGFALRAGRALAGTAVALPGNDAKASLLAYADAAIRNFALTPLLQATHPVRDLVVSNNRLHHNLRNPFTDAMLDEAQQIGRGGISLAVVESAVIHANHVNDNGATAVDPACGVFVGWGNDIEITDNVLAANGAITPDDDEERRRAGLRGGFYIRFAGALTDRSSASTGRKPALRVHDNRVDQPAGRALTAFAFGPVSIANNHLSSNFTGRFGFLDSAVGGVLVANLGGIHRLVDRLAGAKIDNDRRYAAAAETALPGGETVFDANFVRLDAVNRSLMAQAVVCFDDLGYAGNTSSVYRGDPLLCNTLLVGDTLRATAGRLREEAVRTLSLLTLGLRANITAHNQADHCILAQPASSGSHQPRTVDAPNHVFDASRCRDANGAPAPVGTFAAPAFAAHAGQLGGTLEADAFSSAEVATLGQRYTAASIALVNTTQVAVTRAYQREAVRLEAKLGARHPTTVALNARAEAGVVAQRLLATSAEAVATGTPQVPDGGSAISGRLVNTKGQGQVGYSIDLVGARNAAGGGGAPAAVLGRSDANGGFGASFDPAETARLAQLGKLLPRVLDAAGNEVLLGADALVPSAGADLRITLTLPVRTVPRSVVLTGTVIYGTPPPAPPPPPPPPAPTVRTSLDKLDIDGATRDRLVEAGIVDVEGVVDADFGELTGIVGSEDLAKTLLERARRVLGTAPPAAPAGGSRRPKKA